MAGPRTFVKDAVMRLGPATVRGKMTPIQHSEDDGDRKMCSPTGERVEQKYVDGEGNSFYPHECGRATVDEDGVYHMIDPEALEEAKESKLPSNIFNLTVHRKRDTERWLIPSNHKSYVYRPIIEDSKRRVIRDPANAAAYDFIQVIVEQSEYDLIAMANLRGSQGVFKLIPYKGYIGVQRQLYPESLWEYPDYERSGNTVTRDKALAVAERLVAPFETNAYKNDILERVRQATTQEFNPDEAPADEPKVEDIDFDSVLDAFLEEV